MNLPSTKPSNIKIPSEIDASLGSIEKHMPNPSPKEAPIIAKAYMINTLLNLYKETKKFEPIAISPQLPQSKLSKVLKNYQKIIYILLEQPGSSILSNLIMVISIFGILFTVGEGVFMNSASLMAPSLAFRVIDGLVLFIFIIEMLLRIFSRNAFNSKFIRISLHPVYIIDLCSILPLIIQVFVSQNNAISIHADYQLLSLLKSFTILKLLRYIKSFSILIKGFYHSLKYFTFLMFVVIISNFIFAIMIYYAEAMNPKSKISQGIPMALWWSIVTMTTTGYGDVVPVTPAGKVIGSFVGIYGMVILALPVVVLGYHFQEIYDQMEENKLVEKFREREFVKKGSLNYDHKENYFLKSRIDNIELSHEKIMQLLKGSGRLYNDVSSDLKSLYQSMYRGTKSLPDVEGNTIFQRIRKMESIGRSKQKIQVNKIFQRGFGRSVKSMTDRDPSAMTRVEKTREAFRSVVKKIVHKETGVSPENATFDTRENISTAQNLLAKASVLAFDKTNTKHKYSAMGSFNCNTVTSTEFRQDDFSAGEKSCQSLNDALSLKPRFMDQKDNVKTAHKTNQEAKDYVDSSKIFTRKSWSDNSASCASSVLDYRLRDTIIEKKLSKLIYNTGNNPDAEKSFESSVHLKAERLPFTGQKKEYQTPHLSEHDSQNCLYFSPGMPKITVESIEQDTPVSVTPPSFSQGFRDKVQKSKFFMFQDNNESLAENAKGSPNLKSFLTSKTSQFGSRLVSNTNVDLEKG